VRYVIQAAQSKQLWLICRKNFWIMVDLFHRLDQCLSTALASGSTPPKVMTTAQTAIFGLGAGNINMP
jgi:hypothetical protein